VAFFLVLFCLFSTRTSRAGAALRLTCGLLAGVLVFGELPVVFGLPLAISVLLVIVGGLISLWSDMSLNRSLIWFAKRSIRKETVFLIFFMAGIAAIGLRQAQNYANAQAGLSGLSSTIAPGSLSGLSLSASLAMRVRFVGTPPPNPNEAYFRGLVMDKFAGFTWLQGPSRIRGIAGGMAGDVSYKVALSPRYAEFAPVLDYGVAMTELVGDAGIPAVAAGRDNGVFSPVESGETWILYHATSRETPLHQLADEDRSRLLQSPAVVPAAVIRLARDLGRGGDDVDLFAKKLSEFYQTSGFRYSLEPGADSGVLEDFLFKGKSGYCEHYAAASASLARLAGIPARVVAGFLGGTWDADSQTLFVRDLDAHAWSEFWDSRSGKWIRFDGVNYVAPERVTGGAEFYLRSVGANIPDEASMRQKIWASQFFIELDNFLATVKTGSVMSAAESIIDYGEEIALVGALGLTISFVLLRLRRHRESDKRGELRYVRQLEREFERHDFPRLPGEPVHTWLQRCAIKFESLSPELIAFTEAHDRFCYGRRPDRRDLVAMRDNVRRLRPKWLTVKIGRS
jgi:transglutaminase-like putative cysteine protease